MPDPIKRAETTHIDEITRTATSTAQWFLENRNQRGKATHPITHNNKLEVFICGEESFADIASQIKQAKQSIDLCCWGFDPGMELVRGEGGSWPRGETYGDLLIAAGKRGVTVRLLVWYDAVVAAVPGASNPRNMPGYTHDTYTWRSGGGSNDAQKLSAANSLAMLREHCKQATSLKQMIADPMKTLSQAAAPIKQDQIPLKARAEYCRSWYQAAFAGLLSLIEIRTRSGNAAAIGTSLKKESKQPSDLYDGQVERIGMVRVGTHHQKPILIDYAYEEGRKAVGYVMGLNSLTDYWDTCTHELESARREQGGAKEAQERVQGKNAVPGFRTLKPYRDYACRIEGGALAAVYRNFVTAWDRAIDDRTQAAEKARSSLPAALCRKAAPGDCPVQIVRTQPDDGDTTIKEAYCQATDNATLAAGYLYVENQYFQYEEWAQRLLKKRKAVIDKWNEVCAKSGRTKDELPIMHVFIVIPVPERAGMIPRTHDTLATLGQHGGMTGQNELIATSNEKTATRRKAVSEQKWLPEKVATAIKDVVLTTPEVVQHANSIEKPDPKKLESQYGLKICTAMLNVSAFVGDRWRYREIYIHSKLMLVDDLYFTLGSANLNQRSMAVDSEINLAAVNPQLAQALRTRIWTKLSGGIAAGNAGKRQEIAVTFKKWTKVMQENRAKKYAYAEDASYKKMTGFLLPLEDERSSTVRLG